MSLCSLSHPLPRLVQAVLRIGVQTVVPTVVALATLFAADARLDASNYGYSINLNFGAGQFPVNGRAGLFRERTWNNFAEPDAREPRPLFADAFGDLSQSAASVRFFSRGIGQAENVITRDPNDLRLMSGYLNAQSEIVIEGLNFVIPGRNDNINYSVLVYTHGGRPGAAGRYELNGRVLDRIDNDRFDGNFRVGARGNVIVFSDLTAPTLRLRADQFGPINAMSIMYCRDGDFNGDGTVDVSDLNDLNQAFKDKSSDAKYDVNLDLQIDYNDVLAWIKWSKGTCIGDVNLDGAFNSSDLVELFKQGLYETEEFATWTSGDWNGDCKFDSSDLLLAFQEGCYEAEGVFVEAEPAAASDARTMATPEPSSAILFGWLLLLAGKVRRRSR